MYNFTCIFSGLLEEPIKLVLKREYVRKKFKKRFHE